MTLTFKVSFDEIQAYGSKGYVKYVILKFDLDLEPITLILKLDPDMWSRCICTLKMKLLAMELGNSVFPLFAMCLDFSTSFMVKKCDDIWWENQMRSKFTSDH